jgi:magnesium transporter
MFDQLRKHRSKRGLAPGSVVYVGPDRVTPVRLTVIRYNAEHFEREDELELEKCCLERGEGEVLWVNVDGVHDINVVSAIGEKFGLHPMLIEDIAHTGQRPKLEDMDAYLYTMLRMLRYDEKNSCVISEQISLILGPGYVLTFQEEAGGDVFEPLRQRLASNKGRSRKLGADYLFFALLDAIVDEYFVVLEKLGDEIESLEEALLSTPTKDALETLHAVRREALFFRKYVWPLREVIARLQKQEDDLITRETGFFLRDLYDHTIQVLDTIETFRDILSGMADLYLSNISLKLNEIMKFLTIFSTMFIPLTFLAGVWGMNFKSMPELQWPFGYPLALAVMFSVALGMWRYFVRKKWL